MSEVVRQLRFRAITHGQAKGLKPIPYIFGGKEPLGIAFRERGIVSDELHIDGAANTV